MKGLKQCMIVGISLSLCVANAFAHDHGHEHDRECSVETLNGLYLFNATGFQLINGVWQPKAVLEYIRLNGDGTGMAEGTVANRAGDGLISRIPGSQATYTLDADCKGTLQFINGPSFDIFTTPQSSGFQMIQSNPNNVLQANLRRIGGPEVQSGGPGRR